MGTSLTGKQIKNTYKSLIKVSDNTEASASAKQLSDGNGNDFGVYIDTDGVFGIGSAPSYSLDVSSRTDGVALPVGTTANRPTGFNGLIRYNSTIGKVEFYDTGWKTIFTTSGGTISGSVTITGDLTVQGDNTIIEAQTVEVEDNILNLNRTQGSPDTATATTSGISIYRGDGVTEASFIFDDFDDTWDLTNNLVIAGTLQSSSYTDGTATLTGGTLSGAVLADGVTATTQANTDNSTKIATTAYVKSVVTLEDLDFAGGTGTGSVDLDSQTFTIAGTANEIETSASGQTLTIGLPSSVTVGTLNATTLGGTLSTAAQPNITSVGTLSSLTVSGALNGTISTAAQPNITSVGTLSTLTVASTVQVNNGTIYLEDSNKQVAVDPSDNILLWQRGASGIRLLTNDLERMRLHSGGDISFRDGSANEAFYWDASAARLGIGVGASPQRSLHILTSEPQIRLQSTASNCGIEILTSATKSSWLIGAQYNVDGGFEITPSTAVGGTTFSSPALVVNSSGNVGIGTSSPNSYSNLKALTINGLSGSLIDLEVNGTLKGEVFASTSNLNINAYDAHYISFTTGAGTERMRITSGGYLKASNTGSYTNPSGTYHELRTNTSNSVSGLFSHSSSTNPYGIYIGYTAASPNSTSNEFIYCNDSTESKFIVWSNGNVINRNNSYGAISDAKLKENVIDASPKLDDLMQVKVKNFNYIGDDKKQLGVVAQELEEVFPSMIDESPDFEEQEVPQLDENGQEVLDENGDVVMTTEKVDLGTTTKSVKYSVFVPMLIKAMQEQQEIINDLKARIETLEN